MADKRYERISNKPVSAELYGKCPKCHTDRSKIMWGWHGIYYDMVCENGHDWTYYF